MADTVTVRVARGQFWHDGETRTPESDPFDVREAVADANPRTLERVAGEDTGESDTGESESDEPDADGGEGNPGEDSSTEEDLTDLDGVGEALAEKLREAGVESVGDARGADPETLAEIDGISDDHAAALTESED